MAKFAIYKTVTYRATVEAESIADARAQAEVLDQGYQHLRDHLTVVPEGAWWDQNNIKPESRLEWEHAP